MFTQSWSAWHILPCREHTSVTHNIASSCSSPHRHYQRTAKPNNENTRQTTLACRRQGWHPRSSITVLWLPLLLYSTSKNFTLKPDTVRMWVCICVWEFMLEIQRELCVQLWFKSETGCCAIFRGTVTFLLSSGHPWRSLVTHMWQKCWPPRSI